MQTNKTYKIKNVQIISMKAKLKDSKGKTNILQIGTKKSKKKIREVFK
jgi:hypothetical protein